jgi:hypothetical protein
MADMICHQVFNEYFKYICYISKIDLELISNLQGAI